MEEAGSTTHTTYAALFTVINSLVRPLIVVKRANLAKVLGEVLVALDARLALGLLSCAAQALDMGHFVSI